MEREPGVNEQAVADHLRTKHGDHNTWSIQRWLDEVDRGETQLEYIDWRADKLWCAASK